MKSFVTVSLVILASVALVNAAENGNQQVKPGNSNGAPAPGSKLPDEDLALQKGEERWYSGVVWLGRKVRDMFDCRKAPPALTDSEPGEPVQPEPGKTDPKANLLSSSKFNSDGESDNGDSQIPGEPDATPQEPATIPNLPEPNGEPKQAQNSTDLSNVVSDDESPSSGDDNPGNDVGSQDTSRRSDSDPVQADHAAPIQKPVQQQQQRRLTSRFIYRGRRKSTSHYYKSKQQQPVVTEDKENAIVNAGATAPNGAKPGEAIPDQAASVPPVKAECNGAGMAKGSAAAGVLVAAAACMLI